MERGKNHSQLIQWGSSFDPPHHDEVPQHHIMWKST